MQSWLFWLVTAPDSILLAILAAGTALLWTRRRRLGRALVTLALALCLAIAVLPLGGWLTLPLEERFPRLAELPDGLSGIVVLGGAVRQRITQARGQPALTGAAERMTEFVALARRHPELKLAFIGGSASITHPEIKETIVARLLFERLGLDPDRVVYEDQSRNTYENAVDSYALLKPAPGERWALITSAMHMPRAVGVFRKAGWKVVPFPVDYTTTGDAPELRWRGLLHGLDGLATGLHEWMALIGYRLLGRTDAVFPAPRP